MITVQAPEILQGLQILYAIEMDLYRLFNIYVEDFTYSNKYY